MRVSPALALVAAASVLVLAPRTFAQVATGTPPFGSFSGGPETINNANLNVHIDIPVLYKAGRAMNFTYDLIYDSSVWYPTGSGSTSVWQPVVNWGWAGQTEVATGYLNAAETISYPCGSGSGDLVTYTNFIYYDNFASGHSFAGSVNVWEGSPASNCNSLSTTLVSTTVDGSGYTLNANGMDLALSATIQLRKGGVIYPPLLTTTGQGSATDRNGNQMTVNTSGEFFDTLSSTTAVLTVAGSGTPSSPITFKYTAPSGANASYTMKFTSQTVQTNFGCSGITEFGPTSESLVSEIDLPDGSKYTLSYEPTPGHSGDVTGRLASLTLPTGGTISYSYSGGNNGIVCADGSTAALTRTTPDGTWKYAHSESGTAWTTTITDPQNNQTSLDFQGIYETERQVYQGSSTLLKAVYSCYNGASVPCNSTAITLPITQRAVTIQWPGSSNLESKTVTSYNSYGLVTEKDEYAYGTGTPGALTRRTLTSFASLGNGIVGMPSSVTIEDGSANVKGQTNYSYDQTGVVATSGTPQHMSISGSRGNATTISSLVSGSTHLSNTFTYYDTGNVDTATDVNGAQTTYNYSSGSCGNSFPTSVTEPLSLSRSMTWNCTGGVQLTATDENSQTITSTYSSDPAFWRPNAITDQANNQWTSWYQPNSSYCCPSGFDWSLNFTANSNSVVVNHIQYEDGLGRPYTDQHSQSPPTQTAFDTLSRTYDSNGRLYTVSMPCSVGYTGTCSPAAITVTYDALSRLIKTVDNGGGTTNYTFSQNDALVVLSPAPGSENNKQHQYEYDALGRLTSVCEITTASGSGTCGQTTNQIGFWTQYTYDVLDNLIGVTQNAQSSSKQIRTYNYDGLSRLTSETNPESGTTTYAYDSATGTTCSPSSSGDLIKRTDANGAWTCYDYDTLHRVTDVGNSNQNGTNTCKRFRYDNSSGYPGSTKPAGLVNTLGRLIEATTDQCGVQGDALSSDEWFSYTARGEVGDFYESTSNSGGYYHVSQTYWPNGAPNVLTAPGVPTITYTIDGEGRVYSASASSGQNPLTSATYNVGSGTPATITLGSSDTDTFQYDVMNRMKQYSFNVNGQVVVGNLTWNPNGSLGTLAITDPINSANAQTCNYTHDDLSRIASDSCTGSGWSQTFTYDAFGNITKNGNSSFQPSYSYLTNHMTLIGGSTPSYDNDGNVLNDFLHSYTYDVYGHPITIDGVGITYDALGRMVERHFSGGYNQLLYAPSGAKLAMLSGQALNFALVPLASGAIAEYHSGPTIYYHHSDWLGSTRFVSTQTRTMYYDGAYAPFSEPYAQSGTSDLMFTGIGQDTVANAYDFPAREYGIQGRWPSPDPAGLAAANPSDPQTWNRYAYVRNNPLALTDPTGLVEDPRCLAHPRRQSQGGCDYGGYGGSGGISVDGVDIT
jgi:RHS repeat-associated protein